MSIKRVDTATKWRMLTTDIIYRNNAVEFVLRFFGGTAIEKCGVLLGAYCFGREGGCKLCGNDYLQDAEDSRKLLKFSVKLGNVRPLIL